jgi:hypothetical protein
MTDEKRMERTVIPLIGHKLLPAEAFESKQQ